MLDRVLASQWANDALAITLRSELAERAVLTVIEGRLGQAALAGAIRSGLAERAAGELLDSGALARILDSEEMEQLVGQVLESRLVDTSIERVLAMDELWIVIDEVARSPAVTDAIAHQSVGFAGQVAGELGERSRRADARLERIARRLLRRRSPGDDADGAVVMPEPP